MGTVVAICFSEQRGTPKRVVSCGRLVENYGLEGDAHAGPWHRQVSLLTKADIDSMRALGLSNLEYGTFGENLVLDNLALWDLGLGSRLRIGKDVVLTITQRGKICHDRCAIFYIVGDCIMPRHGVFARVLRGGDVAIGDSVEVLENISPERLQTVVLTISDKGALGKRLDTAGPAVAEMLRANLDAYVYAAEILPDEQKIIAQRLKHYADGHGIDLVVTVGGTGFSSRDTTPEAVREVVERLTPGLDEAMRASSMKKTPHAMLSRAVSGIRARTLIVSLPGSRTAATENLDAILPVLTHGLKKLRGDESDCATNPSTP